jgi:hypothetical protein
MLVFIGVRRDREVWIAIDVRDRMGHAGIIFVIYGLIVLNIE